jgi:hypothetical protein
MTVFFHRFPLLNPFLVNVISNLSSLLFAANIVIKLIKKNYKCVEVLKYQFNFKHLKSIPELYFSDMSLIWQSKHGLILILALNWKPNAFCNCGQNMFESYFKISLLFCSKLLKYNLKVYFICLFLFVDTGRFKYKTWYLFWIITFLTNTWLHWKSTFYRNIRVISLVLYFIKYHTKLHFVC